MKLKIQILLLYQATYDLNDHKYFSGLSSYSFLPGPTSHFSAIVYLLSIQLARSLCVCQSTYLPSILSICHLSTYLSSIICLSICLLMISLCVYLPIYHLSYLIIHLSSSIYLLSIYLYLSVCLTLSFLYSSLSVSIYLFISHLSTHVPSVLSIIYHLPIYIYLSVHPSLSTYLSSIYLTYQLCYLSNIDFNELKCNAQLQTLKLAEQI